MGIRLRDAANNLRTVSRIRVRDATNTLRTIQRIRIRDAANVLRTVYTFFTGALSSYSEYMMDSGAASSGLVTSATVTATPTGGTAPYTYAWSRISGFSGMSINTPTLATTEFFATLTDQEISNFVCTITDTNGNVTVTPAVEVTLIWVDTR